MEKLMYLIIVVGLAIVGVASVDPELEKEYGELEAKAFQMHVGPIDTKHYDQLEVLDTLKRMNAIKSSPGLQQLINLGEVSEERCAANSFIQLYESVYNRATHSGFFVRESLAMEQFMIDTGIKQFKLCQPKYHSDLVEALEKLDETDKVKLDVIGTVFDDVARSGLRGNPTTNYDYHCMVVGTRLNKLFRKLGEKDLQTTRIMTTSRAKQIVNSQVKSLYDFCGKVSKICLPAAERYFKASIYFDPNEELFDDLARKWTFKIKACDRIDYISAGSVKNYAFELFEKKRNPLKGVDLFPFERVRNYEN